MTDHQQPTDHTEDDAYVSRVSVRRLTGPDKAVALPGEDGEVVMGSHPAIAPHIGTPPEHPAHASTLDYLVGATAACLAGTFGRALAARGIAVAPEDHAIEAASTLARRDQVPVVERIVVTHRLALPAEHHAEARRVHGFYHRGCAVSRSIEGAIEIESRLDLG
jgi:organic hydroperoxide reductase OsmC/OhrA